MWSVAFLICGVAYVIGAVAGKTVGPDIAQYEWLWVIAAGFLLVGSAPLGVWMVLGLRGRPSARVAPVPEPAATPAPDVAEISYTVADKALVAQGGQWKDLRGRVATLATIGPAAAVVIVTTAGGKFDLLALLAVVFLAVAIVQSIVVLLQAGTQTTFDETALVPPQDLPPGTDATTLHVALTKRSNELLAANLGELERVEEMFLRAAAAFLISVLLWSIHAAANSDVLFKLS